MDTNALFEHGLGKLKDIRANPVSACKICGAESRPFDILDFSKSCESSLYPLGFSSIPVIYKRCDDCNLIFTDFFDEFTSEQWRTHIYNDDYIKVDPEYLNIRPRINARTINSILSRISEDMLGLDYGGGNGVTASLVREKGWNYDSFDPFGHTAISQERLGLYNFCTAFEVFEHTPDPVGTLKQIIDMTSPGKLFIYFSTTTHDQIVSSNARLSWWYAAPRNGHITLYSRKSLQILASKFDLTYHGIRSERANHVLTRGITGEQVHSIMSRPKLVRRVRALLNMKTRILATG